MAGLLAACVLAGTYTRVTVIDRDRLLDSTEYRRGVPQGRHAHILVPGGTQILDRLFPDSASLAYRSSTAIPAVRKQSPPIWWSMPPAAAAGYPPG
jgi:2-polyprenyl-6-methoxyphenol hydroxylase-like FAD-dependent oxidoreductase